MATDRDIELADLLESTPGQMDPGIQTKISAKKEFFENASTLNEHRPSGRGKYFKHQQFMHRALRIFDDVMITSETGTGKTCEILGFTEWVNRERAKAKIDPGSADQKLSHFKRIIVIFRGSTLKNEFNNQLVCKCSDGHFLTEEVRMSEGKQQKTRVKAEISKAGYEVTTYGVFAGRIMSEYSNDANGNRRLAEDFADTIFWVDEAHNLLITPSDQKSKKEQRRKARYYDSLWRVFHVAPRCKRILSTATPMINEPRDIASLMNLLLPRNGDLPATYDYANAPENDIRVLFPRLPFDPQTATRDEIAPYFEPQFPPGYDFNRATLQDLEPRFRGRIGYIRSDRTGVVADEQSNPNFVPPRKTKQKVKYQTVLYRSNMSNFQSKVYQRAKETVEREGPHAAEIAASNFVFPDGEWGQGYTHEYRENLRRIRAGIREERRRQAHLSDEEEEEDEEEELELIEGGILPGYAAPAASGDEEGHAFIRYVRAVGATYEPTNDLRDWLNNIDSINELSCKYASIINICVDEPGNAFVYGPSILGSGIIMLALCLDSLGWVPYTETTSMFQSKVLDMSKSYCASAEDDADNRVVRIAPAKRYALLTGKTQPNQQQSMMEAMNSYENRHGDYIKIFLASEVGKEGINVNNVLQIHLAAPEWTPSGNYQAKSRGLRADSHDDLMEEERQRIIREDPGRNPDDATITVKIYQHAAIDKFGVGIDEEMYNKTENKDRAIHRILRIMKQCAIGCQIHRNRNIRPEDVDGSPACDYEECNYACVDPIPQTEDYSTYDVVYAGDQIYDAINQIENIYRQYNALNFNELRARTPEVRPKYLTIALEHIITTKIPLRDRFGYVAYLLEDNGYFYLDRSYPSGAPPSYAMSYYTQGVIGVKQDSLARIVAHLESHEHDAFFGELEGVDPMSEEFRIQLGQLKGEARVALVERAIQVSVEQGPSRFTDAILDYFKNMIFEINEPVTNLNRSARGFTGRPKRGRKRKPENAGKITRLEPSDRAELVYEKDTEKVYVHNLHSEVPNNLKYSQVKLYTKAAGLHRLFKPSEQSGWRDMNPTEIGVYNKFVQADIMDRMEALKRGGIYGFMLNEEFKLVDPSRTTGANGRNDATGQQCTSWGNGEMIDTMWAIGVPEVSDIFPESYRVKSEMVNLINKSNPKWTRAVLNTWPIQRLVYYAKLYSNRGYNRVSMCELIKQHLINTNRMYRA